MIYYRNLYTFHVVDCSAHEPFSLMPVITAVMLIGFDQSIDINVHSHEEEWTSILRSIFVCIETKSIDSAQRMQAAYSGDSYRGKISPDLVRSHVDPRPSSLNNLKMVSGLNKYCDNQCTP